MATAREILKIVGIAGLTLLIGQGCSQKSVRVTADSETFDQGAQYADNQAGGENPFAQGYQPLGSWPGGSGAQNWAQEGSPYFGASENNSMRGNNSGPFAGLQEYGAGWIGPEGSMANEFIQEDYDNIAEARSAGFSQGGRYFGEGSQSYGQGQGAQGGRYGEGQQSFAQGRGPSGNQYPGVQVELQDVFFEFNSWRISQDGRQALAHDAEWLDQNQSRSITVEGHCDQRGTRDYNLVLGKKRAGAVQTYLVDLGVESHKIQVISYGKERPFCFGNNDQCYQLNRRGHLQLHH